MSSSAQYGLCNAAASALPPSRRRGWLRHGNRPGDYAKAPRCGAWTRAGGCCRQPAMRNGRCRLHGGLSTGPRTPEGLARSRRARWKHGFCSMEIRVLRGAAAQTARNLAALVRVSRGIVQRRTARSSLGMGSIERISKIMSMPLDRSLLDTPRTDDGYEKSVGATGGRPCRHRINGKRGDCRSPLQANAAVEKFSNTSSLGMGSIERIHVSVGLSSGVASRPGE